MEHFIRQQNIALYRKLLADGSATDESRRKIISRLLADEEAKDAASHDAHESARGADAAGDRSDLSSHGPKLT